MTGILNLLGYMKGNRDEISAIANIFEVRLGFVFFCTFLRWWFRFNVEISDTLFKLVNRSILLYKWSWLGQNN